MNLAEIISRADQLKTEIENLRPIKTEQEIRIMQKFRLDWNYHSNAIEGNTLSLGETRAFLLHGITAKGKPFQDYLDIKGHNEAVTYLENFIKGQQPLTEAHIREIHKILLFEPYEVEAVTPDGVLTRRKIIPGQYKTMPNHVRTSTGAIHFYATPEETPAKMGDLMAWYRQSLEKGNLHPLILAATFHYRLVNIHPFDDGNGRMARLLMNLMLMQAGYVPVIIRIASREEYLLALEKADAGELEDFIILVGEELLQSLELYLRGARGEDIESLAGLDKKIALLQKQIEGQLNPDDQLTALLVSKRQKFFDNLLVPLLKKLLLRLNSFAVFFKQLSGEMIYQRDDIKEHAKLDQPQTVVENFFEVVRSDIAVDYFQINYKLAQFIRDKDYQINLGLFVDIKLDDFSVRYALSEGDQPQSDLTELMNSRYEKIFNEQDIDSWCLVIVNQLYETIEQQARRMGLNIPGEG